MPPKEPIDSEAIFKMFERILDSKLESFESKLSRTASDVSEIKNTVNAQYVTKVEFNPYKNVVNGLVGLILIAVVGALLALVIRG